MRKISTDPNTEDYARVIARMAKAFEMELQLAMEDPSLDMLGRLWTRRFRGATPDMVLTAVRTAIDEVHTLKKFHEYQIRRDCQSIVVLEEFRFGLEVLRGEPPRPVLRLVETPHSPGGGDGP
jgi:hypothetical protein